MPDIESLTQKLGSDDQAQSYRAFKELLGIAAAANAPGNDAQCTEVAGKLATELNATVKEGDKVNAKYGDEPRRRIAEVLSYLGDAGAVPALAEGLRDLDLREMCCLALDLNPSPQATTVLINAMETDVGPEFLIGVIAALGRRKGSEVIDALRKAVQSDDPRIAGAAAQALAGLPDADSDSLLARLAADPQTRICANQARIRLAETLRLAGHKEDARRIYTQISTGNADDAQKKAAKLGLASMS